MSSFNDMPTEEEEEEENTEQRLYEQETTASEYYTEKGKQIQSDLCFLCWFFFLFFSLLIGGLPSLLVLLVDLKSVEVAGRDRSFSALNL